MKISLSYIRKYFLYRAFKNKAKSCIHWISCRLAICENDQTWTLFSPCKWDWTPFISQLPSDSLSRATLSLSTRNSRMKGSVKRISGLSVSAWIERSVKLKWRRRKRGEGGGPQEESWNFSVLTFWYQVTSNYRKLGKVPVPNDRKSLSWSHTLNYSMDFKRLIVLHSWLPTDAKLWDTSTTHY